MPRLFDRTEQKMFDEVVKHARKQNDVSISSERGVFAFRGDGKSRCFIGCMISNKDYLPEMEGWSHIPDLVKKFKDRIGEPTNRQLELAIALQRIHDETFFDSSDWEANFKMIARQFNLIYTPPSNT